ncbi:MAG: hypothetical protein IBX56_20080 [Methylomicrobium sp.]|nr:hypothetical protein [Methylomicrobium sp.]
MSYATAKQYDFNLKDEITYKTLETYEGLLRHHESDLITAAQLDCAITALVNAVGWAVSKDLLTMMSEPVERDSSFTLITLMSKADKPVENCTMVTTDIVSGEVLVRSGKGLLNKRVYEADADRGTISLYSRIIWKLKGSYREII